MDGGVRLRTHGPPKGAYWLLLHGKIEHVIGTVSSLRIEGSSFENTTIQEQNFPEHLIDIIDTAASNYYTLFNTRVSAVATFEPQAAFAWYILMDKDTLYFSAAATAHAWIHVLEWTP